MASAVPVETDMDVLVIHGGRPLHGVVTVAGSKNAALPIMAASLLADAPIVLGRVPNLADVDTMALLLGHLGVEVKRRLDGALDIQTIDSAPVAAPADLVGRMRASFCVLGPLLARRRKAIVPLPGGCRIGPRPVDLHLQGLAALGADARIENGFVVARPRPLQGATIDLAGPRGPTVTGTANVLMAAVLARGETIIRGAAREPEIADLAEFLVALGARIDGIGTSTLRIRGVQQLGGAKYQIIPDRIEAATLLAAGAITGGDVNVVGCRPNHLDAALAVLDEAGAAIAAGPDAAGVTAPERLRQIHLAATAYPGVPTDLQAQFMALAAVARGRSTISDYVFPKRFAHVEQLCRLGARIERCGSTATIDGVRQLHGAEVAASDLRASAALVLAGLAADGCTSVRHLHHLDRGYERLDDKLRALGASIHRQPQERIPIAGGQRPPENNQLATFAPEKSDLEDRGQRPPENNQFATTAADPLTPAQ